MTPRALDAVARVRVAQVIESDGPGGAERVVAELSEALRNAGIEVVAVLPLTGEGWLARHLEREAIPVERIPVSGPLSWSTVAALRQVMTRHRISVLHSHEFTMAVACAWAAWRAQVAHVITMHGSRYYAGRLRRRLALRLAARAPRSTLAAVSHALAADLSRDLNLGDESVVTIPNGISIRRPSTPVRLRAELRLAPGDRLVVAVGNLYPVKGHRDLLDALSLLDDGRPSRVHVAIAGRGELAEPLLAHARDLGLADRVHLLGLRADIPELLAEADLFVHPSHSEGLPMAVLEAMGAGIPIVATAVGDVHRALDFGAAGVLVPPRQPPALAEAMRTLLADQQLRTTLTLRAAARVRSQYSLAAMAERYASAYAGLLAPRREFSAAAAPRSALTHAASAGSASAG